MKLMRDNNLFTILQESASSTNGKAYYYFEDVRITHKETLARTHKFAAYLKKNGIEKGDRVIIALGNVPEFIYSFFAVAQVGAISVLVNPDTKRFELSHIINKSDPKCIITEKGQLNQFTINDNYIFGPEKIILIDDDSTGNYFQSIITEEKENQKYEKLEPGETLSIIFTSASDGSPHGAMLTHTGVFEIMKVLEEFLTFDGGFLSVLPFFHSFGLTTILLFPLSCQVPFYFMRKFSPDNFMTLVKSGKISCIIGVPVMFKILSVFLPKGETLPSLKLCISGGEAISVKLQEDMLINHNIDVRQGYGLTEASPIVTWNNSHVKNKFGSVGVPMSWNEIKIDSTVNNSKAIKNAGEVMVKGANVFNGYFGDKDLTRKTLIDGWLRTGDIGYRDNEGYLYLIEREKDMIIKHGLNIYPAEVERILKNHPLINDIKITKKIKIRDDSSSRETLEALVYTKGPGPDVESLKKWCRQNISKYKIPDKFTIR